MTIDNQNLQYAEHYGYNYTYLRGLAGGRGGGGGGGSRGSSSSGGGHSCYNCYNNNNSNGGSLSPVATIVMLLMIGVVVLVICCVCAKESRKREAPKKQFEEEVERLRSSHDLDRTSGSSKTLSVPTSGTYSIKYTDEGVPCEGFSDLTFIRVDHLDGDMKVQYRISGTFNDKDGQAVIDEGFVLDDGTSAWWKMTYTVGDVGLQLLKHGTFDFESNSFSGEWKADTGVGGSFIEFKCTKPSGKEGESSAPMPSSAPMMSINANVEQAPVISNAPESKYGKDEPEFEVNPVSNNGGTMSLFDQMNGDMKNRR